MYKVTMDVEGMACSMCEAHVNEAVRRAVPEAKKLRSSHKKGLTEFVSDQAPDETALREAVGATGYRVLGMRSETVEKRGLFGR